MGTHILFVEDEFLIRLMVAEGLREEGFEVTEASDGDQAAALIDGATPFDLLMTDVDLGSGLGGLEVTRHWRERHPHRPVVFATAHAVSLSHRGALTLRDALLHKPYGIAEAVHLIERVLKPA